MSELTPAQEQIRKAEAKAKREHLELTVLQGIQASELPEPEREYHFHGSRRWRFDFAWPDRRLALEIEGGQFTKGRHNRSIGMEGDCRKYNSAMLLGWRVLRCPTSMVKSGEYLTVLEEALKRDGS